MITETERKYLLDSMMKLLDEYSYNYTLHALNSIIDEWAQQKSTLIEAFKHHPNYVNGKFMIAFSNDYTREFNPEAVKDFSRWLTETCAPEMVDTLPEDINNQRRKDYCNILPRMLYDWLEDLNNSIDDRVISDEIVEKLNEIIPQIHPHAGQKTSRVINKICTYLNYHKHPDYNREFAKFADALNPLTITRHTVLSISPLDYLTMSFGNSWASCHTIDKANKRDMPHSYEGAYSSGTMSYMLDESSMVFYTVDKQYDGDDYWTQPKINRQMFHYGEDKLVQGRLYPQDNDDDRNAYTPYRQIVQSIMSTIFDYPNLWSVTKGSSAASKYIESDGTHYRDYYNFENCSLSQIKGSTNEEKFYVGATPICINCGEKHTTPDNIDCCANKVVCAKCGKTIMIDDSYDIDDKHYCSDCASYCYECGESHLKEDLIHIEDCDRFVCGNCIQKRYFRCEHCGKYYSNYRKEVCEDGKKVCNGCYGRYYQEDQEKKAKKAKKTKISDDIFARAVYSSWGEIFEPQYFTIRRSDEE